MERSCLAVFYESPTGPRSWWHRPRRYHRDLAEVEVETIERGLIESASHVALVHFFPGFMRTRGRDHLLQPARAGERFGRPCGRRTKSAMRLSPFC